MGWCDGVRALHGTNIISERICRVQLTYDQYFDKGSDMVMACGRCSKGERLGKDGGRWSGPGRSMVKFYIDNYCVALFRT
jgi:hypothetical protein